MIEQGTVSSIQKKKKTKQRPVFFILKIRVFTSVPSYSAGWSDIKNTKIPQSKNLGKFLMRRPPSNSCVGDPIIVEKSSRLELDNFVNNNCSLRILNRNNDRTYFP